MSSTPHIAAPNRRSDSVTPPPSQFPLALAAVAFVWFALDLAVRLWGHPGAPAAVGLEPFVLLAVAIGGAAVALRARRQARHRGTARRMSQLHIDSAAHPHQHH